MGLNRKTDADILGWLNQQESKQGAIKTAIRYFLASHPSEPLHQRHEFPGAVNQRGSHCHALRLLFAQTPSCFLLQGSPYWENSTGIIPHLKSS